MKKVMILVFALLVPVATASAVPTIDVGTIEVEEGQAGQTVTISVTGGDAVYGVNFYVGIDTIVLDSAPTVQTGIFAGNNNGDVSAAFMGGVGMVTTTTQTGTVAANGILAEFTVSTVGVPQGLYALTLAPVAIGVPTDFAGVAANITDGFIKVTPEPASALLLGLGGLFLRRRRA